MPIDFKNLFLMINFGLKFLYEARSCSPYNIEVLENCSIDAKNLCALSTNTHTHTQLIIIIFFLLLYFCSSLVRGNKMILWCESGILGPIQVHTKKISIPFQ